MSPGILFERAQVRKSVCGSGTLSDTSRGEEKADGIMWRWERRREKLLRESGDRGQREVWFIQWFTVLSFTQNGVIPSQRRLPPLFQCNSIPIPSAVRDPTSTRLFLCSLNQQQQKTGEGSSGVVMLTWRLCFWKLSSQMYLNISWT